MTRSEKITLFILTTLTLLLAAYVFRLYLGIWKRPLGPTLQISTIIPIGMPPTWTPPPATPALDSAKQTPPSPTPTPLNGLCNAPATVHILLIGSDARGDTYTYGLADVIRLVRVEFATPRVSILEFPRDLWVEIPDIADNLNGQKHAKLNQAYLYGNPGFGYTNDPAQGPGLLARTLTLNFGTRIDHYAAINMHTFVKIVNALGGIDVYLPEPVDGRTAEDTNDRLFFRAGWLHLDGTRALTLARIRIEGSFARADNQNRVLCALRDKLTRPEIITKLPELIHAFKGSIQTDLSPEQISQLACIGTQIKPQDIHFLSFPEEHFKPSRVYDPTFKKKVFIWEVDFEILRKYVQQFNEGTWFASQFSVGGGEPQENTVVCP
ncbi:MAG TPA: LCP family protein [Anaerolineales bacterium]|nr:LCP family protein [Anaerolineales bacterium]